MPSALQSALAFQGIAGGVKDLVGLLLERRERERQEASTQAFLQAILPLLSDGATTTEGGAPGVQAQRAAFLPQISVPAPSPGPQDGLRAAVGALGNVKLGREYLPAILSLLGGERQRRLGEVSEERKSAREQRDALERIRVGEEERRKTAQEELKVKRGGLASQAKGALQALTGVPALFPGIESQIEADQ